MNVLHYCQKLLRPSHCLIQFAIVQGKIVHHFQLILHASRVEDLLHTQFDFTGLEKIDFKMT